MKKILKWIVFLLPFLGVIAVAISGGELQSSDELQLYTLFLSPLILLVGIILTIINIVKGLIHISYIIFKGEGEKKTKKPYNTWLLIIGTTYLIIGILGVMLLIGFASI